MRLAIMRMVWSVVVVSVLSLSGSFLSSDVLKQEAFAQAEDRSSFLLQVEARRGNTRSQYLLGIRYLVGAPSLPRDVDQGVYWLKQASDEGYDLASIALGNFYVEGILVEPDQASAAQYYRRAALSGNTDAQIMYGHMVSAGVEGQKNENEAVQWFKQAALAGDVRGQYALGLAYLRGTGVLRSQQQAVYWLRKAADSGNAKAMFSLGIIYLRGEGVERNEPLARTFFVRSMERGYSWAGHELVVSWMAGRAYGDLPIDLQAKVYAVSSWLKQQQETVRTFNSADLGLQQRAIKFADSIEPVTPDAVRRAARSYDLVIQERRFRDLLAG